MFLSPVVRITLLARQGFELEPRLKDVSVEDQHV